MYQQLIDVLLDSAGFDDVDPHNQVFNLTDTLYDIDTRDDRQDLLKIEIKRRAFSVSRLAVNSRHEFIKSKDRLTDRGDSIGTRLDLSRVRFNKEMNKGLLQIEISCGFLCGYGYQCQIEKIDGKWIVKNCRLLWIS